jgi:Ribbon-helix-helix protein, copG family
MQQVLRELEAVVPPAAAVAQCPWWVVVTTIVLIVFLHGGEAVSLWLDALERLRRRSSRNGGRTAGGSPITNEPVDGLSAKVEADFDAEEMLRRHGGRPPTGSAAAGVESVRLDPELREALARRARRDHETTSAAIREALRQYLKVA